MRHTTWAGGILVLAITVLFATPAKASVGGYAACWTCNYSSQQYIGPFVTVTARCVLPESGYPGFGTYCRVVDDTGFFLSTQECEFAGSECLYIEVTGRLLDSAAVMMAERRAPLLADAKAVYLF